MGSLDQPGFEAILQAGCTACGGAVLDISSIVDKSISLMVGDPTNEGRWAYDGEKFVDGIYQIGCAGCRRVVWSSDVCPRCNQAGALASVLGTTSRVAVPKRCPKCNELELMAIAMVPVTAKSGGGERPKPVASVDFGDAGYHVVAFACDACDHAVVAEGCPLCGAAGPLRPRP